MALFTKSILKPLSPEDGLRLSVMSRHTRDDGITPDPRLARVEAVHLPRLGPAPRLIGDFKKRRTIGWEEFRLRYAESLKRDYRPQLIRKLADMAARQNVTLLCIEETPERCHRLILAEEFRAYRPDLRIEHR